MRFLARAADSLAAPSVPALSQSNAAVVERKQSDVLWDDIVGWQILTGTGASVPRNFEQFVLTGFRAHPVVSACVREIVTSLSEAPIYAYRPTRNDAGEQGFERMPGHPAEELLAAPNKRDPGLGMIERLGQHFLLGGNAILRKRRVGIGLIESLHVVAPSRMVSAITDDDNVPLAYRISNRDGTDVEVVDALDIVLIPDLDPLNDVFGMPRLLAAALDITTDKRASQYTSEMLANHGTPGLVVGVSELAKKPALERAERQWEEKFGPGRGRGRIAFAPGVQQIHEIGFSLKDLEFQALRNITREGICAAIGPVDPMLVGIGSAARGGTLSGSEHKEARKKLWQQTLIPIIRRFEAYMNVFLAPEWGDVRLFFALDEIGALQEDRADKIKRAKELASTGVATEVEVRTECDLEPDAPEDAYFIRTPAQTSVLVADAHAEQEEPPAEREPVPPGNDEEDDDDDEEGNDDE